MYHIHSHPDGEPFRPVEQYSLQHSCLQCPAQPGEPCARQRTAPRRTGSHITREERGQRVFRRDLRAAPWPSEMVPGQCYSTLPGCE